jgi:putative flavoprotein involved in K+ transport
MPDSPVVIVGGGAAGLSAAAALARRRIESVVLDQDPEIGTSWARRYARLRLHTVRGLSNLPYFPMSRQLPRYPSRDEFVRYLQDYARHFELRLVHSVSVRTVRRGDARGWIVEAANGHAWPGPVVVIATGQYRQPIVPNWDGRERYRGVFIHSSEYVDAAPYASKRVLVVGAGNTGGEVAVELSEHAASVALSVRTPPPIIPRDPFGLPVQQTGLLLSALPPMVADRLGWATARLTLGDVTRQGMPPGRFDPFTKQRVPLIDVGLVDALKKKRVTVRPAVEQLTESGAVFADGSQEPFDAVIAATGFSTGLASIVDVPGVLNADGEPIGTSGSPTTQPGLYFVGFTHSLRGHLFETNLAARRLARHVEAYLNRNV